MFIYYINMNNIKQNSILDLQFLLQFQSQTSPWVLKISQNEVYHIIL